MDIINTISNNCLMFFISKWFWLQLIVLGLVTVITWDKITEKSDDEDDTVLSWFSALFIIIISSLIIFCPESLNNINSYNYLLSAISQSLAALFALVFALMFTLTQISKNDRAKVKSKTLKNKQIGNIFTKYVLIYIISFVFAIVAPLFLMGSEQTVWIKAVLYFAVCNVAMLIPFFWRFKITLTSKNAKRIRKKM